MLIFLGGREEFNLLTGCVGCDVVPGIRDFDTFDVDIDGGSEEGTGGVATGGSGVFSFTLTDNPKLCSFCRAADGGLVSSLSTGGIGTLATDGPCGLDKVPGSILMPLVGAGGPGTILEMFPFGAETGTRFIPVRAMLLLPITGKDLFMLDWLAVDCLGMIIGGGGWGLGLNKVFLLL